MANPSTPHPAITNLVDQWSRCRDVVAGQDQVRSKGQEYLPKLDTQDENTYARTFLQNAHFFNAASRTVDGMAGALFTKLPEIEVPKNIEVLLQDSDNAGTPLTVFAHDLARDILTIGRGGILVDQGEAESKRPYLVSINGENLTNWASSRVNGVETTTMVMIRERSLKPESEIKNGGDPYKLIEVEAYRELYLDPDSGNYSIRVWKQTRKDHLVASAKAQWAPGAVTVPTRRGVPLTHIPFVFVNPRSLAPKPEKPPLLDLVDINLAHFRIAALRSWVLLHVGSPMCYISGGPTKTQQPVNYGSSNILILPSGGKIAFASMGSDGVAAIKAEADDLKKAMEVLGGRLLESQPSHAETAHAVSMRHQGEMASLSSISNTLGYALQSALQYAAWWAGSEEKPTDTKVAVKINSDFLANLSDKDISSFVALIQNDVITRRTAYAALAKAGLTRPGVDFDQESAEIEADEARIPNAGDGV